MNLADVLAAAAPVPGARMDVAVVSAVVAGAAADGAAAVTVTYRGQDVPAAYGESYTPVVGHVVLVLVQPPSLVVVDRIVGTPTT